MKLQRINTGWLQRLQDEVVLLPAKLASGEDRGPSLAFWCHGKSAAMKKPAVESSEPSQYLQSMFDAFSALQEKVQLQVGLTCEEFPAAGSQPRSSNRLLHLSKRLLTVRLFKEMQEAFRVWVVRFLHFEPILNCVYLPVDSHQNSF
jgi:hypothetical protein